MKRDRATIGKVHQKIFFRNVSSILIIFFRTFSYYDSFWMNSEQPGKFWYIHSMLNEILTLSCLTFF